ncbi:hypothetical protein SFRURICE_007501 [Spodoptera frugiperda]|nr:hypothetical protein SFRURICE_007501 [Spodoptera frugiperda]
MDTIDFCDSSGSDIVEEEMPHGCKQQVNNKNLKECGKKADKRLRSDNEEIIEDEEGFITVRKDKKRLLRRPSMSSNCSENNESTFKSTNEKIIVCVTSKEVLPKPFGMAKLLRSENIKNILKIQYKNPYKILIQFEDRKDAECLIKCSKFQSLDYRCQFIEEINLSYGVVKQIDLDIEEKEILESIESEKEVVSAKRLRRQSESGEWIQSETIRICFKSSALPPYLLIYGCRFKVEPYTFPVSQCSGCWRFGHLIKSCPTKKLLCPKCGGNHSNCETITFTCINCKGPHMSMNKSCPMFKKEKAIRKIMCEEHCTYRRALTIYLNKSNSHQTKSQFNLEDTVTQTLQAPQISPQSVNCDKEKKDRADGYGGVAIIVHKSITSELKVSRINNTGIEILHVKINNCKYLKNIVSVYCPSSIQTRQCDWDESLIVGDFNGHHSNWSYKTDTRGIQIMDSALENGFIPINDGSATRPKRLALKQFRRNPTPENLAVLENKTLKAKQEIRQAKTKCWQEFCSAIDGNVTSSEMWRKMKWIKGYRQTEENIYSSNPLDMYKLNFWCSYIPLKNVIKINLQTVNMPKKSYESNCLRIDILQELNYTYNVNKCSRSRAQYLRPHLYDLPLKNMI